MRASLLIGGMHLYIIKHMQRSIREGLGSGVMCSRLGFDQRGRRIVVQTTPEVGITVGTTFVVVGDSFECVGTGIYFMATVARGRAPTAREQAASRGVYYERRRLAPVGRRRRARRRGSHPALTSRTAARANRPSRRPVARLVAVCGCDPAVGGGDVDAKVLRQLLGRRTVIGPVLGDHRLENH